MPEVEIERSLWPKSLRAEVRSPTAILRAQADMLSRLTGGKLRGELTRNLSEDKKRVTILLDIVAPTLEYRHRILSVSHGSQLIYPATVEAAYFQQDIFSSIQRTLASSLVNAGLIKEKQENEATSDTELIELIEKVLGSPMVESLLLSLVALESEIREGGPEEQPSTTQPAERNSGPKPENHSGREAESSDPEIPPPSA